MDQNEVAIAFDIVLEEIENAIAALNQEGAQAFQCGKYDLARELMEKGSQMTAFRTRVVDHSKGMAEHLCLCHSPQGKEKEDEKGCRETEAWFEDI